jgi:hypothetical protein
MQFTQTLRVTSPVLLSISRCSQTPLEPSTVLSDSAQELSGASENTCSYGHVYRMLRDLLYKIGNFGRSRDLCTDLWQTSKEDESASQHCRMFLEQPQLRGTRVGDFVPYSHSCESYITTRHFVYHICLCYSLKICYSIIWHALLRSLYRYTYSQSWCRWYWGIIGAAPGYAH